ncbi:hypothetical protein P153DRAFT_304689 [Dothidotthia symphoricarpi CBS 119687]|uniref:UDENN domain-containing protein n=1 Tax=Dothidotthia symphoricarpi CBS 119687 TaxID=1392245 RepID=A0A6A6AQY4_9PLEO|nr:uncharacterized protein P153DRAFT_304689 [Dothidotthia symphoricarpi CBS 119687]KAF2134402.1 hypothetical protein P153DRAFT_304689 [Dothidotthia symphoricarpi CBS 119687]
MEKFKNKILHPRKSWQEKETKQTPGNRSAGFQHWAIAFIVCNFNVDVGPEIEILYPPDVPFTTVDLSAICFNSFPEQQNTETAEDLTFNFAITNNSPDVKLNSPHAPHGSASTFHGSCVFRQEFDGTMKRSFNQRTLVLISHHNFPAFYNRVLQEMTASGSISDPTTLETAYSQVVSWPPPSIGRQELPFMGKMLTLDIAPHPSFPLQGLPGPTPLISDTRSSIYAYEPVGSWDTIMHFMPCITDLYVLYEKLILCESIIVIAKSPQLASEAISSLLDLICPVPYAGVIKPYMTMQADFRSIGIDGGTPRPFIVGVTNPFLLKRIVAAAESSHRARPHILYLQNFDGPVPTRRRHSLHHTSSRNALLDLPGGGIEVHTPSKRFLKSDSTIVSQIEALLKLGDQTRELDLIVRRHFAELTAQFVAPINRYLATSNVVAPGGGHRRYASFSAPDFLQSVSKYGTSVKFRVQVPILHHRAKDGLYESFCNSPNFYSWLEMKMSLENEASAGSLGAGVASSRT